LRLNESAGKFGINTIFSYSDREIENTDFYRENRDILSQPRGHGYWLWKPYIILESLHKLNNGDVIIYSDSGIEIIAPLDPLVQICLHEQPILLFANGNLINSQWTKRDCFILMGSDEKACRKARQCDGACILIKKTADTIRFVEQWLEFGKDPRIITDIPNTLGKKNSWRFIEHRHDQSILSIMAYQGKLNFYRSPTQFGNHYKSPPFRIPGEFNCVSQNRLKQVKYYATNPLNNSPYYQLLNQHRSRKNQEPGKPRPLFKKLKARIHRWI
jgi:hypothetical protein